jgi:hypothetical protein
LTSGRRSREKGVMGNHVLEVRRWLGAGLVTSSLSAVLVAACGSSGDDAASHGTGAGRGGGNGAGASGGTAGQGARAGAGGDGVVAGSSNAAGTGSGAGGMGTGGAGAGGSSAAGAATGGSGGAMGGGGGMSGGTGGRALSDACVSPCLRDLFMKCRPQLSCLHQPLDATDNSYIECEADRGFRLDEELVDPDSGMRTLVTTIDGAICYSATYVSPVWTYHDANGTPVATVTLDQTNGNTGTCPLLDGASSTKTYLVDTSDARCAPLTCTPGTCDP